MTEKTPEDEKRDDAEFQRVLGNLAKMPPAPHPKPVAGRRGRPKKEGREPKPAPKE